MVEAPRPAPSPAVPDRASSAPTLNHVVSAHHSAAARTEAAAVSDIPTASGDRTGYSLRPLQSTVAESPTPAQATATREDVLDTKPARVHEDKYVDKAKIAQAEADVNHMPRVREHDNGEVIVTRGPIVTTHPEIKGGEKGSTKILPPIDTSIIPIPNKADVKAPELSEPTKQKATVQVTDRPTDPRQNVEEFEIFEPKMEQEEVDDKHTNEQEITRGDGDKPLTQKQLQELADKSLPEKIVVSDAIRQEIDRDPHSKLKVVVPIATELEWKVALASEVGSGKTLPESDNWSGDTADALEKGAKDGLWLPAGFTVVDTGREVPVELIEELQSQYPDASPRVIKALAGQYMHATHDWDDIDGDVIREFAVPGGSIDALRPEKLEVGELKSDTPSEIVKAAGQGERYIKHLQDKYGLKFSGSIHVYRTRLIRNQNK